MNAERIIEAVMRECADNERDFPNAQGMEDYDTPLITALVNLAMSGVCPECYSAGRTVFTKQVDNGGMLDGAYYDEPCANPLHDHREALDALIAERG